MSVAPLFIGVALSPNNTSVTLNRAVPLMVTSVPISPDAGENEVMVKGVSSSTVKLFSLSTVP